MGSGTAEEINLMNQQLQVTWDAFLQEWPIERLRRMTLREYSAAGDGNSFTAWM